ncbi:hypothetical protein ABS764_07885 [Flavobacterium sp. ST-87]|uniref:Uncharacterized protein n=1 Tax=Flavobacterium plantiphilum TaxID=3163297 RepID=A0ABW8XSU5_9FLAO
MKLKMLDINYYHGLALICTIGVFIFSYLAQKKDGNNDQKEMRNIITQQSKKLQKNQEKISKLTSENNYQISLSNSLGNENKRLGEENNRLASENNRLAGKTKENTEQIIGAGSYPIISIGGGGNNTLQIIIMLKGKYAIPNLTARAVVIPNYTNVSGLDMKITPLFGENIEFGTLRPHEFNSYSIPFNQKEVAALFYFKSDNNNWNSIIRIKKIDNKLKKLIIISESGDEYKFVHIDDDFPMNSENSITLWSNSKVSRSILINAANKNK